MLQLFESGSINRLATTLKTLEPRVGGQRVVPTQLENREYTDAKFRINDKTPLK